MRTTLGTLLLCAALSGAATAQDDPPYDIDQDELECEDPPFRLERPNDSWLFVDLDTLRQRAAASGQDTSRYDVLKGQLWYGAAQANMYVFVYPDQVVRREPPAPEEFGQNALERLQNSLGDADVEAAGRGRVGRRAAFLFEIEGVPPGQTDRVVIMQALVYRPEDQKIFVFHLEAPADGDRTRDVKRDFARLLRSARL